MKGCDRNAEYLLDNPNLPKDLKRRSFSCGVHLSSLVKRSLEGRQAVRVRRLDRIERQHMIFFGKPFCENNVE